jgi:hypothetical protein
MTPSSRSSLARALVLGTTAVLLASCSRTPPDDTTQGAGQGAGPSPEANLTVGLPSAPPTAASPWNPAQIDWQPYEAGLALAKRDNKPVCLVLYTAWCPHCRNYSRVFSDARLVARARDFVMIRLDADENEAVARRYHPDGTYVPRTFILDADGNIDVAGQSDNPRYRYFFDEHHADSLLAAMDRAAPR